MRAHAEIEKMRDAKKGEDLLDQLLWRIRVLGGEVDLTDGANRRAFAEVLDAYAPENYSLVLNPAQRCRATLDQDGEIAFWGNLVTGGNIVAELERRLFLGRRFAEHRRIRVVPSYRGNRIAPRCLIRSVELYDQLRFELIKLRAAYSGSWYWAQWGFHFENPDELARLQEHAQELIDIFGGGLDATTLTHPVQFFRLGEPATITFDELADALPQRRDAYEQRAHDNGLGMHDPVPFGRIVLLTGPSWDACLHLAPDGADRLIFNDRASRLLGAEGAA